MSERTTFGASLTRSGPIPSRSRRFANGLLYAVVLGIAPLILGLWILHTWLHTWNWDFSIPIVYTLPGKDDVWQLVTTKTLIDTGWILENKFLGAPSVAGMYDNSGAQTSALHSVLMLFISKFMNDPVRVQQTYFFVNFSLITISSFAACRAFGIKPLISVCIGFVFAFTTYRVRTIYYAYLPNYFMIPVSLVPIFGIMTGNLSLPLSPNAGGAWRISISQMARAPSFWVGLVTLILMAVSDGYYAFFSLLLLGFATVYRVASVRAVRIVDLLAPLIYIAAMFATALFLLHPIRAYRLSHPAEVSQDALKSPVDAQVYAPSPMLLIAPLDDHRWAPLASLGRRMIEVSNFNRKFPMTRGTSVPLGTLGTILFALSAFGLMVPASRATAGSRPPRPDDAAGETSPGLVRSASILSIFVFLCSIVGGGGGLIAFLFPSIRAYDRFPIFMIFALLLWAGAILTPILASAGSRRCFVYKVIIVLVTAAAILDQVPRRLSPFHLSETFANSKAAFLAERHFVHDMEASLPVGAMVYQYPFSQFLTDSKYYGWGSYGQVRLYLHSHNLHWSNGASKGSPVDDWHARIAQLPIDQLLTEARAVGFNAFVVDRSVVPQKEYEAVRAALIQQTGTTPVEDDAAHLAYARIDPPGFRIVYDPGFKEIARIVVEDRSRVTEDALHRYVDRAALARVLDASGGEGPVIIDRALHPEVFVAQASVARTYGEAKITPISDMKGDVLCEHDGGQLVETLADTLPLTVNNRSSFDWALNAGTYPIEVGIHLYNPDGSLFRWEGGRVTGQVFVPRGGRAVLRFPLSDLKTNIPDDAPPELNALFTLLQEHNAWVNPQESGFCRITIRR